MAEYVSRMLPVNGTISTASKEIPILHPRNYRYYNKQRHLHSCLLDYIFTHIITHRLIKLPPTISSKAPLYFVANKFWWSLFLISFYGFIRLLYAVHISTSRVYHIIEKSILCCSCTHNFCFHWIIINSGRCLDFDCDRRRHFFFRAYVKNSSHWVVFTKSLLNATIPSRIRLFQHFTPTIKEWLVLRSNILRYLYVSKIMNTYYIYR